MKIFYKVLRRINGKLVSGFVDAPGVQIEYKPNELRLPDITGSKLFVFRLKEAAIVYASELYNVDGSDYEVWSCETTGEPILFRVLPTYLLEVDHVLKYWSTGQIPERCTLSDTPFATILVDSVTITEKVWDFMELLG